MCSLSAIRRSYTLTGATPPSYVVAPTVSYSYDGRGMPPGVAAPLSAQGRLTAVKSAVSETLFTAFDPLGRVTAHRQVSDPATAAAQTYGMSYAYDLAGNLTTQVYPSGRTVTHLFDTAGRLSSVSGQPTGAGMKTYAAALAYTAHGAVEAVMLGNLLWEHTQFNLRLQPTEMGLGVARTDASRLKLDYRYGALVYTDEGPATVDATKNNGNVQSQSITAPNLMLTQSYTYDEVNRLRRAGETNGGGAQSWQQTFTYDRYGNRRFDPATTTAGLMTENPVYDPVSNRITPQAGEAYEYDAAGNLTRDRVGNTFAYDGENRQVQYNGGASGSGGATYSYDGDGRRVEKVAGVVRTVFVYNVVGQMVAEYSSEAAVANGTQYLTSDSLGTPRVITGADGAVKGRHDYLPFGEEVGAGVGGRTTAQGYSQADGVRQQFTSAERDGETGLDYMQARYFSSTQGRFTSPDPLLSSGTIYAPQTWNRYSYGLNNPLKYIDPSGLYVWDASLGGNAEDKDVSKKIRERRNEFRNALAAATKAAGSNKLTPDQQSEILRAVQSYGAERVANGVGVAFGKVKDGAAAQTGFSKDANGKLTPFTSDANGKVTANITVTFGGKIGDGDVAHEGSHVADRQALGTALEAGLQGTDFNRSLADFPENVTQYATELRAYRVSSSVDQVRGTPSEVWNKGWREADRDKAINSLLRTNKLYRVTPEKPGLRIYTEKDK